MDTNVDRIARFFRNMVLLNHIVCHLSFNLPHVFGHLPFKSAAYEKPNQANSDDPTDNS